MDELMKYYRSPGLMPSQLESISEKINGVVGDDVMTSLKTELCFYIKATDNGKLTIIANLKFKLLFVIFIWLYTVLINQLDRRINYQHFSMVLKHNQILKYLIIRICNRDAESYAILLEQTSQIVLISESSMSLRGISLKFPCFKVSIKLCKFKQEDH